ncbi:hypothetical protein, partial [Aliivibrio fischeri]|uniref:hypothetical protein n=1 Tax=Aliivibrio fischeri TaxID=668 RepID=UPI0018C82B6A
IEAERQRKAEEKQALEAEQELSVEYPTSELQDINDVVLRSYVRNMDDEHSIWTCGVDARGVHIVYTHPETNQNVYYFRSMQSFGNSIDEVRTYLGDKMAAKEADNYQKAMDLGFDFKTSTFFSRG